MKIPTAKKLPSGSWFCRVRVNGKDVSITRPTKKEAIAEAVAIKTGAKEAASPSGKRTITAAIDAYIEARKNVLSPSTIAGYRRIQRQRFQSAMGYDIFATPPERWQNVVNLEARIVSPKTLKNAWCFVSGVIADQTGRRVDVRLPQQVEKNPRYLEPEQIQPFLDALKGDTAEIPALLALSSLRMSEVLGLKWSAVDLENGMISIEETAVRDENGLLARKQTTKNTSSRRLIPIIPPLRDALEKAPHTGVYVTNLAEHTIRRHYKEAASRAGVPYVGAHGLRHSFASLAYHLGLSEEAAMKIGGWADPGTMRKIYTHLAKSDLEKSSQKLMEFFKSGNKIGNE